MRRAIPFVAYYLILVMGCLLFDQVMDADARQQCFHPEELNLTDQQRADVCNQAGVTP